MPLAGGRVGSPGDLPTAGGHPERGVSPQAGACSGADVNILMKGLEV